jgi:hypothetical protein
LVRVTRRVSDHPFRNIDKGSRHHPERSKKNGPTSRMQTRPLQKQG